MEVLLICEILIGLHLWIVSLVSLGEFLVTVPVWQYECESDEQDHYDLVDISRAIASQRRDTQTSAILEIMQTITPVV